MPKHAVFLNGSTGDWSRTTVWVLQGYPLSTTLFNIFIERITSYAQEDHKGYVSIDGRIFINFHFADDIVVNADEEEEGDHIVTSIDRTCT